MNSIKYEIDSSNIVTLTFDELNSTTNIMNRNFRQCLADVVLKLKSEKNLCGVILASAKQTFFAGGDLSELNIVTSANANQFYQNIEGMKGSMRTLETLGVPVVAALNGLALGGGFEIALCATHRIALDSPRLDFGLPEVTLGLLPGASGVTKMVRLLGVEKALPLLLEGRKFSAKEGLAFGLIQEIASSSDDMMKRAIAHIKSNPKAQQPYDKEGFKIPGGLPNSPQLMPKIMASSALLMEKTKGCYPASEAILACAVEGALVDFDTAL